MTMESSTTPSSRPPLLSGWIAGLIAEQIIAGELVGGQRLLEADLAARYGLSRAPVREALRLLAGEGLVELLPQRGVIVRPLSSQEIDDLYTCRAALEGMVARLAATRITEADLDELRQVLAEAKAAAARGDIKEFFVQSLKFYAIPQRVAGNKILSEMSGHVAKRVRRLRFALLSRPGRLARSLAALERLVEAYEQRDPEAAEQIQRQVILAARDELLAALPTLESAKPPVESREAAEGGGHRTRRARVIQLSPTSLRGLARRTVSDQEEE